MLAMKMKTIRYAAWAAIALVVAAIAYLTLAREGGRALLEMANATVGGPFELIRADGGPITDRDLRGRPYAIFFGFTNCPEICPTTLYEASGWLDRLGEDADKIDIYFVTVDPERDTPRVLGQYMTSFPEITAITGDREGIDRILKAYKVYSRKVPLEDGGYTMDHTATVYLMDAQGEFSGTIAWREDPDIAFAKIRRLVDGG